MARKNIESKQTKPVVPERFLSLEGLRGLAAIVVVVYHFILIFYPNMFYGFASPFSSPQHMRFEDNLYGSLFTGGFSGVFAVAIFFVLSGFVLSIGFFQTGDETIIKKLAVKRYVRLMIPALVSVVLACVIIATGLSSYREVAVEAIGGGSAAVQWDFISSFFEAIKQGVWSIFATGEDSYNRVLWTMHYEFLGSLLVFFVLFVFGKLKYRNIVYLLLMLITFGSWYIGFIFGMVIADNYKTIRNFISRRTPPIRRTAIGLILLVGLVLGSYPPVVPDSGVHHLLTIPAMTNMQNLSFYLSIGAALIIIAILTSNRLSALLSHPRISGLGKYTFSLYLTHILVFLSFTVFIFSHLVGWLSYNIAAVIAGIISIPVFIIVAHIFYRYVDKAALNLSGKIPKLMGLADKRRP